MTPDQLKERLAQISHATASPSPSEDTLVEVMDLTGTQDHYQAIVVSPAFEGKLMIEQHRMVLGLVQKEIDSGEVHALTLKTFTPAQYRKFVG